MVFYVLESVHGKKQCSLCELISLEPLCSKSEGLCILQSGIGASELPIFLIQNVDWSNLCLFLVYKTTCRCDFGGPNGGLPLCSMTCLCRVTMSRVSY